MEVKTGDIVAVICVIEEADAGVYPDMHLVMPISDDNLLFFACSKAMIGKLRYSKEENQYIIIEEAD